MSNWLKEQSCEHKLKLPPTGTLNLSQNKFKRKKFRTK